MTQILVLYCRFSLFLKDPFYKIIWLYDSTLRLSQSPLCIIDAVCFKSPEPKAQGELCDWSLSGVRPSCVIRKLFLKQHLLLNHRSKFQIISHECPRDAVFQNCINYSAPLNRRAARALDKKSFKRYLFLNHWPQLKNVFTELFLIIPSTKISQIFPLR